MTLLTLKDVTKAYGGVPALKGVDLQIAAGEIHALMGENGAGKSTLIKILAGVVAPDRADIRLDGTPIDIGSPRQAHRLGFRFIHQEFNVVPALSVAENIFMGRRYPRRGGWFVDWKRLNRQARETLDKLGINHIDPAQSLGSLSLGDQMLVRLSSAFIGEGDGAPARLYVLDEPTAALNRAESERLFVVLRELRAGGASVLYVSHRLDEVMELCDMATVMRDGRSIDTGKIADITHDDLVALMIGRRVEDAYPPALAAPREAAVLQARELVVRSGGSVSFDVRAGEIFGVAGIANEGQRNLLRALFGDLRSAGQMTLSGQKYRPRSPADAWRAGVGYIPRERRSEGLVVSRPIFENVTLPHLRRHSRWRALLQPRAERHLAADTGRQVRLKASGPGQRVNELSGGNQQKVVFAKALAGQPRLLLLDEPTRGVDVGAKFDIYTIIRDMAARGMGVILVSSDLPELLGMADRIAVMRDGAITDIVAAAELDEERLLNLCYGRATG